MNKNTINAEAAKATLDNANKVVDLTLRKSVSLLEKNIAATKATLERQASYSAKIGGVRNLDELPALQKEYAAEELKAIESFSKELYDFGNEASTELASISESNRSAAEDMVAESLEQVASAIPNGGAQPYGSFFSDMVRSQIEAYKQFNTIVDSVVTSHRDNLNAVAKAMGDLGQASKAAAKKASKR
ncbi:MAG: phasin family protein [Betaproteobacteria bacterium AqS2]|uniref:Phasin family protein n=1 Tax=Candidatus Amphirhobacter heronislandensis TaxID=1732024 RepID=A0A930Y1K4_9GAMM|nr:phasin family protein [Betaproteobacteria bacterium AqS2]